MAAAPPNAAAPDPPQSLGERILSSIPVVMTVVATLLAGLSSSEMTQAQYHRSLAAQYQSKAGDQWNFFQAKRQRGAVVGGQADALRAELAGRAEKDFQAGAEQLAEELLRTARRAEELLAVVTRAGPEPLRSALAQLRQLAAGHAGKGFASELSEKSPGDYLAELRGGRFNDPRPALLEELAEVHADLPAVLAAIDKHKSEAEIAVPLAGVKAEQLSQAVEHVEKRARELDDATRNTVDRFDEVNRAVTQQAERLRPFHAAARAVARELDDLPVSPEKEAGDVRPAGEVLRRLTRQVAAAAAETVRAAQLARNEYNERRYECEARYNQVIGGLYEAQVRKSSLTSDRHRQRSYQFFYCMLVAQAGVTLATFALAVRQMSALWGLASLAGLAALAAGVYVYWFV